MSSITCPSVHGTPPLESWRATGRALSPHLRSRTTARRRSRAADLSRRRRISQEVAAEPECYETGCYRNSVGGVRAVRSSAFLCVRPSPPPGDPSNAETDQTRHETYRHVMSSQQRSRVRSRALVCVPQAAAGTKSRSCDPSFWLPAHPCDLGGLFSANVWRPQAAHGPQERSVANNANSGARTTANTSSHSPDTGPRTPARDNHERTPDTDRNAPSQRPTSTPGRAPHPPGRLTAAGA